MDIDTKVEVLVVQLSLDNTTILDQGGVGLQKTLDYQKWIVDTVMYWIEISYDHLFVTFFYSFKND